jgi:hypothetical protein
MTLEELAAASAFSPHEKVEDLAVLLNPHGVLIEPVGDRCDESQFDERAGMEVREPRAPVKAPDVSVKAKIVVHDPPPIVLAMRLLELVERLS